MSEYGKTLTWWLYVYFQTVRIGADEEVDDFKGMTEEEVREILEEKEAKANAQILEMVRTFEEILFPDHICNCIWFWRNLNSKTVT